MSGRAAEIIEAVLLLKDLGKPVECIGSQLDLTASEVMAVIKTGQIPFRQKTLFANELKTSKAKKVSRADLVKRAFQIHPAAEPKAQQTVREANR
jgi:hypothetical protein